MISEVKAVTFDDFLTLRYPMKQTEDIIYSILRALKRTLDVNEEQFLKQYFKKNQLYQKRLRKTLRETLLDDMIASVLASSGYDLEAIQVSVRKAVDFGLATRKASARVSKIMLATGLTKSKVIEYLELLNSDGQFEIDHKEGNIKRLQV
jgi:predicted PP-loop superfamily ATPase